MNSVYHWIGVLVFWVCASLGGIAITSTVLVFLIGAIQEFVGEVVNKIKNIGK